VLRRHFGSALGDHYAADDATQQVLLNMVRALPRYRHYAQVPFGSWVYRIARRQLLRHVRDARQVEPMAPDVVAALRDQVEAPSARSGSWLADDRVAAAYEGLPEAQRRVLVLKFGFGLQSAEIGAALGMSAGNVRQLQRRALTALERECAPVAG
jgi:RNA polymerase sigma factor (sigma-70 family)